jgi:hypothetical protein
LSTKITGTITSTVTLGNGLFLSPLTITSTGLVDPSSTSAIGIYLMTGRAGISTLVNDGRVFSGNGAYSQYNGGFGGDGVGALSSINLVNAGTISGGYGGSSGGEVAGYHGGQGGFAVVLYNSLASGPASSIFNTGLMIGGTGGSGALNSEGGDGGGGVFLEHCSVAVSNAGVIRGGAGGAGYFYQGGRGGSGVEMFSGSMFNSGSITGGAGGFSYGANAGTGGSGAFVLADAVLTNTGIITGGVGGNSNNENGGQGGYGVGLEAGGTLINAGTIGGGAGGYAYYYHSRAAAGVAVAIYANGGTVVAEDGAVFNGAVVALDTMSNNVLEVAGTSGAVLSGIGTQFTNFNDIAFAQGATRGIEGNSAALANGQTITGFTAGDTIILDGYEISTALAETTGLVLVSHLSAPLGETLALGGSLTGDFIGHIGNGNSTITTSANTNGLVLKSGFESVAWDGVATATTIGADGYLIVGYGGYVKDAVINHPVQNPALNQFGFVEQFGGKAVGTVLDANSLAYISDSTAIDTLIKKGAFLVDTSDAVLSNTTIAGGTLLDGGTATGFIDFTGKGGTLGIAGAPAAVISGFAAGDQIVFFGTPYAAGDKVSVKKAGEVTVTLNGVGVDLAVAGVKKGDKDFKLTSGTDGASLTLKGGKAAATNFPAINLPGMTFLTPPQAIHAGGTALPSLQSVTASQQKPLAAANPWVASALPPPAPVQDLLRVPHGGIETLLTLQSGL